LGDDNGLVDPQAAFCGFDQPMGARLLLAERIEVDTAEQVGWDGELDAVTALTDG